MFQTNIPRIEKALVDNLFPYLSISEGAYWKAIAYINATIEELGIVESYMYGLRDPYDSRHIIRDVYFPVQKCSSKGVMVEIEEMSAICREIQEKDRIINSWIHHHCYHSLIPSTHFQHPINDEDNSIALLNELGHINYKKYKEFQFINRDELTIKKAKDREGIYKFLHKKSGLEVMIALEKDLPVAVDDLPLQGVVAGINVKYSYIFSLILNPTIMPISKKLRSKIKRIRRQNNLYPIDKNDFQEDVCNDPYAEVAFRRWTPYHTGDDECHHKQFGLKIINVLNDVKFDYLDIRNEVRKKAKKGVVQSAMGYITNLIR